MPELGTTKQQRLNSVDADFQTRYVAAEQAYGAGDFQTAQAITSELMAELEPLLEAAEERDAALAWQAFVALLAGHIQLYGLQQTDGRQQCNWVYFQDKLVDYTQITKTIETISNRYRFDGLGYLGAQSSLKTR